MPKIHDVADSLFRVGDAAKYAAGEARNLAQGVSAVQAADNYYGAGTSMTPQQAQDVHQTPDGRPVDNLGNVTGVAPSSGPSYGGVSSSASRQGSYREAGQPANIGGEIVGVWTGKGNSYIPGSPGYVRGRLAIIVALDDGRTLWKAASIQETQRGAGGDGGGGGGSASVGGGSRTGSPSGSSGSSGSSGGATSIVGGALSVASPDVVKAIQDLGKKLDSAFSLGSLVRGDR